MNTYTRKLHLIGLFLVLFATSCSTSSLEDVKTKDDYIKRISNTSDSKFQKTLQTDIDSLTSLKEELDGFNISISFGMSMEVNGGKKAELKPDSVFKINTDFNAIKQGITAYSKNLSFVQTPGLPNSNFEISPTEEPANVSSRDVDLKVKKLYAKGQAYPEDKIGMKRADSLIVDFNYEYPKSFETFKFNPYGKKEISYNKQVIELDSTEDGSIEFDAPIPLYKDILFYQAVNPSGMLMNTSSQSAMPLTTIKASIKKDLASAIQILKAASKLNDKNVVIKDLNQIAPSLFPAIAQYRSFTVKFKNLENDKTLKGFEALKRMKDLIAENKELFGIETQRVSLKFPDKAAELVLYITKEKDKITGSATAKAQDNHLPYQTYFDSQSKQYGIIDSNYNILVPAFQTRLDPTDNSGLYYKNEKENQVYHLDARNKKLVPFKKGYTNVKDINDHLTIFSDSNKYVGVLENNDKVVIPFEYDEIQKTGNVLLLTRSKRGRKKYEIRTIDNKLVTDIKGLAITAYPDYGVFITEDDKEQFGMIDKNGKTVIPPTYHYLEPIDQEPLLLYSENANSDLKGIMKGDRTKVTEPKFVKVNGFQEGFAVSRTEDIYNDYGYINHEGKSVFGNYKMAYGFAGGYALVLDDHTFSLIDHSGKKVKQIPCKVLAEPTISLKGKNTIYEIEGKKYNYTGQPVN